MLINYYTSLFVYFFFSVCLCTCRGQRRTCGNRFLPLPCGWISGLSGLASAFTQWVISPALHHVLQGGKMKLRKLRPFLRSYSKPRLPGPRSRPTVLCALCFSTLPGALCTCGWNSGNLYHATEAEARPSAYAVVRSCARWRDVDWAAGQVEGKP